jgi:hypothetical protein
MSPALDEVFSAQEYLRTYYPNDVDQEQFLGAINAVEAEFDRSQGYFDVGPLVAKTGLPHEMIENAALVAFFATVARHFLGAFPRGDAVILDVGGGPTIYQHIAFCLNASVIIHSDYLAANRTEVVNYLTNTKEAYLWETYITTIRRVLQGDRDYAALLGQEKASIDESIRTHAEEIEHILSDESSGLLEKKLKASVEKEVVYGDVFSDHFLSGPKNELRAILDRVTDHDFPDIVSAYFLVESATHDPQNWEKGMCNLIDGVVPGGYLVLTAIRHASWYRVGEKRVRTTPVDEYSIGKFLREHGIVVEELRVLTGSNQASHGYDGMVFVLGRKKLSH